MPSSFAIPAAAVVAVAGYLWLLNSVSQRPPQHAVAATATIAEPAALTESQPALPTAHAATPADISRADEAEAEAIHDRDEPRDADTGSADDDAVELSLLLQNGSESQRVAALREAGDAGTSLPLAMLLQALRYDRSERVRAGALDYLAESGATRRSDLLDALSIAERDADSAIQSRAHELRRGLQQLALAEADAENLQQSASSYR